MSQCSKCGKVYDESEGGCPYCGFMGEFRKLQIGSKKSNWQKSYAHYML